MAGQSGLRAEVLAALIENGPGSGPMRQTAAAFRQLAQTFETLASEVESQLAQLLSTMTGETAEGAARAFRQFVTGAREMATVANGVSEQAESQAVATDNARSSMPKLAEILRVLAAISAALSSQNYGLAAALMALYNLLSARASSTMSSLEAASLPNMQQTPPQPAPPITNQGANAFDASQLLDEFTGQDGQSFTPPEPMGLPPSTSSILDALNGGGFGGGSGGFNGIGDIGMKLGVPVASLVTPFFGLGAQATTGGFGPAGSPATASPTPMGGTGMPVGAAGRPTNREEKRVANKPDGPGVIVDPLDEDVPQVPDGIGVVADAGTDADAEAEQPA